MFNLLNRFRGKSALPEEKKHATQPYFAFHRQGGAHFSPQDFGSLAQECFMRNPVVYRCVRMISEAAANIQWQVLEEGEVIDQHPMLELLKVPNHHQSGRTFFENLYGNLLISGNAYVQALRIGDDPKQLHCLRPDKVLPVYDDNGWPVAWEYTASNKKILIELLSSTDTPLLHLNLYNPLDETRGHSPLIAAHMAVNVHNAASLWNKALLDNSARPSGALVYEPGNSANLTKEQFDRLKAELEEGYSGASKAGRPMLLEGGLDWKAMGYSPRDMDFMQAKNGAARDIALALGVPPMLLGIPGDNTFSNYQQANRSFWLQTVIPLAQRTCEGFSNWLGPKFDSTISLKIDYDKVDILAADRQAMWQRIDQASFLTQEEKRNHLGLPPII